MQGFRCAGGPKATINTQAITYKGTACMCGDDDVSQTKLSDWAVSQQWSVQNITLLCEGDW